MVLRAAATEAVANRRWLSR